MKHTTAVPRGFSLTAVCGIATFLVLGCIAFVTGAVEASAGWRDVSYYFFGLSLLVAMVYTAAVLLSRRGLW